MRLVGVMVVLGGCQLVFDVEPPPVQDDGSCVTRSDVFTDFDADNGNPCNGAGIPNIVSSTVEIVGGQLHVTPTPDVAPTAGGCIAPVMDFDTGVFFELVEPFSGAAEYTFFRATWDDGTESQLVISGFDLLMVRDGMEIGRTPFDESARWWRMRPRADRTAFLGEVSPDGRVWTAFAIDEIVPPARVKPDIAIGAFNPESTPSTTIIDNFNVCPL